MTFRSCLVGLFPILTFIACAGGPTYVRPDTYPAPPDHIYDASFDAVWNAVLEGVVDFEIPIENMEKASGFLRSDIMLLPVWGLLATDILDCGKERAALTVWRPAGKGTKIDWRPVTENSTFIPDVRLTVLVREVEGGVSVRLRIRTRATALDQEGRTRTYSCESKGTLEEGIFKAIERRIRSQ